MKYVYGENYLCFYALLEMILADIGYRNWDQYSLANTFGVVLPGNYSINGVENVETSSDERMYGAHVDCKLINRFMEESRIPLKVSYIPSNPYGEYNISKSYLKDKYCIYTYSYGSLHNASDKLQVGHASLFLRYTDGGEEEVEIYDPGPIGVGIKTVKTYLLNDAMYDSRGGLYIFEKTMNRCFLSRKDECGGGCKYCFGKWKTYLKFPEDETIEDNTIVYPNCDGDAFDNNWNDLLEKIKLFSGQNIIVSISTKFNISDSVLESLEEVNRLLQKNGGMLKLSVSFSCEQSICLLEQGTAAYSERIGLVRKIIEMKIPYFTIIKPILPFIDFSEYKKIIDDTITYCPYYVIGDLYVDMYSDFYREYIENKNYIIYEKEVAWNGENGKWRVIVDNDLKEKIEKYITQLGGKTFESDKDAIIYTRGVMCDE